MKEQAANKVRHLLSELADDGLVSEDECDLLASIMTIMVKSERSY